MGRVALFHNVLLIVWVVYLSFTVCDSLVGSCISLSQCVINRLGRVCITLSQCVVNSSDRKRNNVSQFVVWLIVWVV